MRVTVKAYIHQVQYPWQDNPTIELLSSPMKSIEHYVLVNEKPVEIEIEIPDDFDPRPKKIAALEAKKRKVQAEFAKRVAEIDDQISKYLAIAA